MQAVDVDGTPFARGRQHGSARRDEIAAVVDAWHRSLGGLALDDAVQRLVHGTDFAAAIDRWTPGLGEEVRGIAAGAGIDADLALALSLGDELWVLDAPPAGCSALAVRSPDATIVAQTMDIEAWLDGSQTIVRTPDANVLTHAGCVALNGVNRHGLAVCCNTLASLPRSTSGLPVAFVVRGILEQRDVAGALRFLAAVPHASGQSYVLGDRSGTANVECSAAGVVSVDADTAGRILHTNHPLGDHEGAEVRVGAPAYTENSEQRLAALQGATPAGTTADDVLAALARPPVCRERGDGAAFTFAATVAVLAAEVEHVVTHGPPSASPPERFRLRRQ